MPVIDNEERDCFNCARLQFPCPIAVANGGSPLPNMACWQRKAEQVDDIHADAEPNFWKPYFDKDGKFTP